MMYQAKSMHSRKEASWNNGIGIGNHDILYTYRWLTPTKQLGQDRHVD